DLGFKRYHFFLILQTITWTYFSNIYFIRKFHSRFLLNKAFYFSNRAIRSPSLTKSPSETRSSLIVPASSVAIGISIFIDSRITLSFFASSLSPSLATIFHTLPAILALISTICIPPKYFINNVFQYSLLMCFLL